MPQTFTLEVAFNSKVAPAVPGRPIAMAYAFADRRDDTVGDTPDAQNLKLLKKTVPKGARVMFNIYDTATYPPDSSPPYITEVTIKCTKANTTIGDSPFGPIPDDHAAQNGRWVDKHSITAKPILGNDGSCILWEQGVSNSVGCNVRGKLWNTDHFIATKEGAYEFTLTVKLSNGREFEVDPEMEVREGNG